MRTQNDTQTAALEALRKARPNADARFLQATATLVACAWEDHTATLEADEADLSPFSAWEALPTSFADVLEADLFDVAATYLLGL